MVAWTISVSESGRAKSLLLHRPNSFDNPTDSGNHSPGQHYLGGGEKQKDARRKQTADRTARDNNNNKKQKTQQKTKNETVCFSGKERGAGMGAGRIGNKWEGVIPHVVLGRKRCPVTVDV